MATENLDLTFVGATLTEPDRLLSIIKMVPSSEYLADKRAASYYECILETFQRYGKADLVLCGLEVQKRNLSQADFTGLMVTATEKNLTGYAMTYAGAIVDRYKRRQAEKTIIDLAGRMRQTEDAGDLLTDAISTLSGLRREFKPERIVTARELAGEVFDHLDSIRSGQSQSWVPFGFTGLDEFTGGMEPGDLEILAGPEKSGKSTLMIQVIWNTVEAGKPALIWSAEMKRRAIFLRRALIHEHLKWTDVKGARLTPEQWTRLNKRIEGYSRLPLFIREGSFTIFDIMNESREYVENHGVALLAVDYLQRVVPVTRKANENREREVSAISSGLKSIAMEYNIPVLALSQVNDDFRARESRAVEQDMDKMITLKPSAVSSQFDEWSTVDVKVRQRFGYSGDFGDVQLQYNREFGYWA